MAHCVGAFGVPHTPMFVEMVAREGQQSETGKLFATVREAFEAAAPDLVVLFDTDHLNTFFFDNLPIFAIGIADQFLGPNDETPSFPPRPVPSRRDFARHLQAAVVADGFDLAMRQAFDVDHSVMIPLHFLTPAMQIPVVPVFISGHVPPLPSASRAHAFGAAIRRAIDAFAEPLRVAVIGTGSFSLDVLGPQIAPGMLFGVPDPEWAALVHDYVQAGELKRLMAEATTERMKRAGNVAGELLNWIAMLGTLGEARAADWMAAQPRLGHSYAYWREAGA